MAKKKKRSAAVASPLAPSPSSSPRKRDHQALLDNNKKKETTNNNSDNVKEDNQTNNEAKSTTTTTQKTTKSKERNDQPPRSVKKEEKQEIKQEQQEKDNDTEESDDGEEDFLKFEGQSFFYARKQNQQQKTPPHSKNDDDGNSNNKSNNHKKSKTDAAGHSTTNENSAATESSTIPVRKCNHLYVAKETLQCALQAFAPGAAERQEDNNDDDNNNPAEQAVFENNNNRNINNKNDAASAYKLKKHLLSSKHLQKTVQGPCVSCAYKIGCFDVAMDHDFVKAIPNRRPEECPRDSFHPTTASSSSKQKNNHHNNDTLNYPIDNAAVAVQEDEVVDTSTSASLLEALGYVASSSSSSPTPLTILIVGDGDFSFSLALARRILPRRGPTSSSQSSTQVPAAVRLIATSYESKETLLRVYCGGSGSGAGPDVEQTLQELTDVWGVTVCFQVDATRLEETLVTIPSFSSSSSSFRFLDRILWNFPCTAVAKGQDGQNAEFQQNQQLLQNFVRSATPFLRPRTGQIHMNHKTKPPFNQWRIEDVVVGTKNIMSHDDDGGGGSEKNATTRTLLKKEEEQQKVDDANGDSKKKKKKNSKNEEKSTTTSRLTYLGRVVLDRSLWSPYIPRKALDRKSFPIHDACTYIFGWSSCSNTDDEQEEKDEEEKLPQPKRIQQTKQEQQQQPLDDDESSNFLSLLLIQVDDDLIRDIRQTHLDWTDKMEDLAQNNGCYVRGRHGRLAKRRKKEGNHKKHRR